MPRLTAGHSTTPPNDSVIIRVDISPKDIREMSDEELHAHLAALRPLRETAAPRASRTKGSSTTPIRSAETKDDLEEMD